MEQIKTYYRNNSHWLIPVLLLLLSLLLILKFNQNFSWPVGVGYDSVIYINGAESLSAGTGYSQSIIPITHYPPLYSVFLAVFSLFSQGSIISAATILVVCLYGLNAFLAGLLVWRVTRSGLSSIGASVMVAVIPGLVDMHFEAMSEPLFFALILLWFIFLFEYFQSGKLSWLILAGVFSGLSTLTRYIGIFAISTTFFSILLLRPGGFKKKLLNAVIAGFSGSIFVLIWLARNQLITGGLTNRMFIFHPKGLEYYLSAFSGFADLLGILAFKNGVAGIPNFILVISAMIALALGVYLLIQNVKYLKSNDNYRQFLRIGSIAVASYLFFILFSVNFFDASTRLTGRILSPLFLILIISAWILIWPIKQALEGKSVRIIAVIFLLLIIGVNLPGYVSGTGSFKQKGLKFTGKEWATSATVNWLKELPDEIIVYSNEAVPIGFLTDHPTYTIPEKTNSLTGLQNEDFVEKTAIMMNDLINGKAIFIKMTTKAYSEVFQPKAVIIKDLLKCKTFDDSHVFTSPDHLREYCDQ